MKKKFYRVIYLGGPHCGYEAELWNLRESVLIAAPGGEIHSYELTEEQTADGRRVYRHECMALKCTNIFPVPKP